MANLKEVRTRIESVKSTEQITNAMKMVAASKLRKAQRSIQHMRPYAKKLNEIITDITATADIAADNQFTVVHNEECTKKLVVVLSSNRGLCGPFNAHIVKATLRVIEHEIEQPLADHLDMVFIGKKAFEYFKKNDYPVKAVFNELLDDISYQKISALAQSVMDDFLLGLYEKVYIIYNRFENATVQTPTVEQFLPVKSLKHHEDADYPDSHIYEPEKKELLDELVPRALKIQFFKTVLDTNASEQGARMTAMHQATDNARELLKDLQLSYNKARQAAITNEIIEIVGGAEALNS
ncbi:MAG: ATP synthase F1 subunit gamma [Bacteroidales bacterium]|nr:ATP synthase F1 subunit gamma [Bacteroidales bacterium]